MLNDARHPLRWSTDSCASVRGAQICCCDHGFYVHRILIVDDFLWPPKAALPSKELHSWILSQYSQEIQIGLVRVSELEPENDLLVDFGPSDAAVGYPVTDELGQTVHYEMLLAYTKCKRPKTVGNGSHSTPVL